MIIFQKYSEQEYSPTQFNSVKKKRIRSVLPFTVHTILLFLQILFIVLAALLHYFVKLSLFLKS